MVHKLTEEEQKEYERLQKLERFWKLIWKLLPKHVEDRLEEFREKLKESVEVSNWIKEFRKLWKEGIERTSDEHKEKIISAAENIKVDVEVDSDGSRLIKFKLWDKTYKILDPMIENHTDDEYSYSVGQSYGFKTEVCLWWMMWDNVDEWRNKKLKEYLKEKQREWLHIPKIEEMEGLLSELWGEADLSFKQDQIAMLMYLTGMAWWYWLSMWDDKRSWSEDTRSRITCSNKYREISWINDTDTISANLLMMSCN